MAGKRGKGRKRAAGQKKAGGSVAREETKKRSPWLIPGLLLLVAAIAVGWALSRRQNEGAYSAVETVKIETSKGDILMEVYPEKMPITASNFLDLVKRGFYDGLTWHRVEDWVVQTGDPQGTGMGGSGKTIKLETHDDLKNVVGAVAMARSQARDSASSQFYILKKEADWLDGDYAVFGKVNEECMGVVNDLAIGDKMNKVTIVPKT
jgi:peptidyl-prolyl cis-trans isomerase B (cyclophilin B)